MRRMDSDEKRKRCYDDESDWVTEEDYLEDSDPCKPICSGEERWPARFFFKKLGSGHRTKSFLILHEILSILVLKVS